MLGVPGPSATWRSPSAIDLMATVREVLAGGVGSVLVVEDNPDTVRLYADLLAEDGLDVRTAANGREGLDRLAESVPSVIVLDLMMPVMDGFTFLEYRPARPGLVPDPRHHSHGHDPVSGGGRPTRTVQRRDPDQGPRCDRAGRRLDPQNGPGPGAASRRG